VDIQLTPRLPCSTCGTELLLSAAVPHPRFRNSTTTYTLCPRCHAGDAAAQGLLAFFTLTPTVDAASSLSFARLLQEWLQKLPEPAVVSQEAFEQDVEAFYRGDFDS
jgi:hypothetical protein